MAENQATITPAQPDYELLVCWFLPDGKINVTRTPILAWRVEPSGKATPVTIDVRHGEGLTAIRAPGGRITDAAGESYDDEASWLSHAKTFERQISRHAP